MCENYEPITFASSAMYQIKRGLMDDDLDRVIAACEARKVEVSRNGVS